MSIAPTQSDSQDQIPTWQTLNAMLNILEDFQEERSGARESTRAVLNILADLEDERGVLNRSNRAMLNILVDFQAERDLSTEMNRAVMNILEDLEEEKERTETLTAHLEERVLLRTADLAASNAELQQFAYVASHDLQEPLRAVGGCTQILKQRYQDKLDARADQLITHVVDGVTRMQTLINDLLEYSRVGTRAKPFQPTDCATLLKQVLANLEVAIQESGAVVTHDPLPTVLADDTQLAQLFQNLIGNAIRFRNERLPEIHFGAEHRAGEWLFSVRDNGIGIDPQYFERIFVIFQRLHTRTEYPGTGMGLAICKKIVERHGGRIWVASEAGKGATFYFTISDKGGPS